MICAGPAESAWDDTDRQSAAVFFYAPRSGKDSSVRYLYRQDPSPETTDEV